MRGEVLKPDEGDGQGIILGEDGRRYAFRTDRVHKRTLIAAGTPVDFITLGDEARDIYVLSAPATAPAKISPDAAYMPAISVPADNLFTYFLRALSRNYFKFEGRARRAEYWGYTLFFVIFLFVTFILDAILSASLFAISGNIADDFLPLLTTLSYLYCIIPGIAITVRRLHDQDMSGWLYLINGLPYIGGLIIFILMFFDSRPNPNKHGLSPKYGAAQTVNVFT